MSQENVEVVRRIVDAWSRRDLDALLTLIHEEGEWHPALIPGGLEGTVYRGPRGMRSYWREVDEVWAELSWEADEISDVGEGRVLVLGHFHAVGHESGVPIDQPMSVLFTIEGGKVRLGRGFTTRERALEAAGLTQ